MTPATMATRYQSICHQITVRLNELELKGKAREKECLALVCGAMMAAGSIESKDNNELYKRLALTAMLVSVRGESGLLA